MPRTARPQLSDEELRDWFVDQQPLTRLLYGLRAVGFTADAIAEVTAAPSRDTVYAWAADRSVPSRESAEQLDRLRAVVSRICVQDHLGPGSVWLVLNGWPGGLDTTGPTALELLTHSDVEANWLTLTKALGMGRGHAPRARRPAPRKSGKAAPTKRRRARTAATT